jgi:hypothetical protein
MMVTEPDLRQTYFDLARQWRELAAQVEELTNGTVNAPNGNGRPSKRLPVDVLRQNRSENRLARLMRTGHVASPFSSSASL